MSQYKERWYELFRGYKFLDNDFHITCEYDLHIKVVFHVRQYIIQRMPHLLMVPTLGELQYLDKNNDFRNIAKTMGYMKGSPDLVLPWPTKRYHGLVLEFKYGRGSLSAEQQTILRNYKLSGYCVFVNNNYDRIIDFLREYSREVLMCCPICEKSMKHDAYEKHLIKFHTDDNVDDFLDIETDPHI